MGNARNMVRLMKWHCPADTGFEIRALAVWGRAPYLSITEAPQILKLYECTGKKCQSGVRTRDLRLFKQTALTTAPGPPPLFNRKNIVLFFYALYNTSVRRVHFMEDLGVRDLSWIYFFINTLVSKCNWMTDMIWLQISYKSSYLCSTFVRSNIEHCSTVWSPFIFNEMQSFAYYHCDSRRWCRSNCILWSWRWS